MRRLPRISVTLTLGKSTICHKCNKEEIPPFTTCYAVPVALDSTVAKLHCETCFRAEMTTRAAILREDEAMREHRLAEAMKNEKDG